MALKKYLDPNGVEQLVRNVKRSVVTVYTVKGNAIFADADYLAGTHPQAIDSTGIWQLVGGVWTKITVFEAGWVYNIENAFTTDASFTEGAGISVSAGSNIVCQAVTPGTPVTYTWDILGSMMNLDAYQLKTLTQPLTTFNPTEGTAVAYPDHTALPTAESKAAATISEYTVAYMTGSSELGDVYRAHVEENAIDPTVNDITWFKVGNELTVEGAIEMLSNVCPNTPISNAEIDAIFARV